MPDREKIIKGLKYCTHPDGTECLNRPYYPDDDCVEALNSDALELLKEQEEKLAMMRMIYGTDARVVGEIVRCNDCKHYCYYGLSHETVSECTIGHEENPDENWFCADGERSE